MKTIVKIWILSVIFILSDASASKSIALSTAWGEAVKKETRNVAHFTGIKVGGAFEVFIKQTGTPGVMVEADEEILPYIVTEVTGDILRISMMKSPPRFINDIHTLHVYVTVAELKSLDVSGAVELTTQNEITGETIGMDFSGAVEAELKLKVQKVRLELSGACEVDISGEAREADIETSGASELDAFDFVVTDMSILASGATEANVNASGTLKISASGACEVKYKGGPSITAHTSGASSVRPER